MYLRREHLKRYARAPAKLNLYLEILGRRRDGFHELETLMVPIRLFDWLTFETTPGSNVDRSDQILLTVRSGHPQRARIGTEKVPSGPENLVVKALQLLRAKSGCRHGARIELIKFIPAAAGLGGASSDAAAALCLANRAWKLDWSDDRLATLAAEVGSDVPFFIYGRPAICQGRGERVRPLCHRSPIHVVVVAPPAGLHTVSVYQAFDDLPDAQPQRSSCGTPELAAIWAAASWRNYRDWMQNRLQNAAAILSPWVERLRSAFTKAGCPAHQLSGSGSAYFGICRHAQHAKRLATLLRMQQLGLVYATKSYR